MYAKYSAAILISLCLVQGFNARSTYKTGLRISDDESMNKLINNIMKSAQNIEELIQNLDGKIEENVDEISLPEIITYLEEQIEKLTEKHKPTSVQIITCLTKQQATLRFLELLATEGVQSCKDKTSKTKNEILEKLTDITARTTEYISYITLEILKCEHGNNNVNKCLSNLVETHEQDSKALLQEIAITTHDMYISAEGATGDLSQCMIEIRKEIDSIKTMILTNYENCIVS